MEQIFKRSGDLEIAASSRSSQKDFDFLVGKWEVHNRKLKSRLSGSSEWIEFEAHADCRKILNGFGNIDSFQTEVDRRPFEGMSLRLFNPKTRLWSIYWANSETVVLDVPQIGSFEDKIGSFYARDSYEGKEVIVQFRWDATNPNTPVWSQAFSPDNGHTWEWNWYMTFHSAAEVVSNEYRTSKRIRVSSSSIVSVGYDAATETLEIEFVGGGVYQYFGVTLAVYESLMASDSLGRFVNTKVKEHYRCVRLDRKGVQVKGSSGASA